MSNELVDFIKARLGEDEHAARAASLVVPQRIERYAPARVLREVEAKQQMLDEHHQASLPNGIDLDECNTCGGANEPWPCPTLRLLARPYSDHPQFREEWRL